MKPLRAYAHARVCAAKSRLHSRADLLPLMLAENATAKARALQTLGIDRDQPLFPQLFARLMAFYETVIDAYKEDAHVFLAMLRVHELENLKLLWRAITRSLPPEQWLPYWRDVKFATLDARVLLHATSVRDLADRLAKTPYRDIAKRVAEAHGNDLAAAELAFDQWGTAMLRREGLRELAEARDTELRRSWSADLRWGDRRPRLSMARTGEGACAPREKRTPHPFTLTPAINTLLLAEAELRNVNRLAES